jgi:hypothetical protein
MDSRLRGNDDPRYFLLPYAVIPVSRTMCPAGIHAGRRLREVLSE